MYCVKPSDWSLTHLTTITREQWTERDRIRLELEYGIEKSKKGTEKPVELGEKDNGVSNENSQLKSFHMHAFFCPGSLRI